MYDIHVHTKLSECADQQNATVENFLKEAKNIGIDTIGFSNHMWDSAVPGASGWYKPQNFEHISQIKSEIPKNAGIKVLFGAECDFTMKTTLGISEAVAEQLDYLLVPHSHTHMVGFTIPKDIHDVPELHAKFLYESFIALVSHPLHKYITAVAHPFHPVANPNPQEIQRFVSDDMFKECFTLAAENEIACEINACCFRRPTLKEAVDYINNCELLRMFTIARECGCKFTTGTDSHTPKMLSTIDYIPYVMKAAGIGDKDILKIV